MCPQCFLSYFLSLSLSSCNILTHTIDSHIVHKEMNVERLRNLLKVTQLISNRVKNKQSYFRGLILYIITYCFIT